jgi:hypothetical protein
MFWVDFENKLNAFKVTARTQGSRGNTRCQKK